MDEKWVILTPKQFDAALEEQWMRGSTHSRIPAYLGFLMGLVAGFLLAMLLFVH